MFSDANFFFVSGSTHERTDGAAAVTVLAAAAAVLVSCARRASNHSFVTGGKPAAYRYGMWVGTSGNEPVLRPSGRSRYRAASNYRSDWPQRARPCSLRRQLRCIGHGLDVAAAVIRSLHAPRSANNTGFPLWPALLPPTPPVWQCRTQRHI